MKNKTLTLINTLALISISVTSCKKETLKEANETAFTISSSTFKNNRITYNELYKLVNPQVSCKNIPSGTRELIALMEDNHNKHEYWFRSFHGANLDELKTPIKNYSDMRFPEIPKNTTVTLEVFALKSTYDELDKEGFFKTVASEIKPRQKIDRNSFRDFLNRKKPSALLATATLTFQLTHVPN